MQKHINDTESIHIVISHFHFLKVLEMCILNESVEWYENYSGHSNGEVHIIENGRMIGCYTPQID